MNHLSDEQLSEVLDGVADRATEDHLASCAECSARRASLAAVTRAVAEPWVPPPSRADAWIAAAIATYPTGETAPAPAEGGHTATIAPLVRTRRRWAMPPPAWIGVAAAALVILVGSGVLLRGAGPSQHTSLKAATSGADRSSATAGAAASAARAPVVLTENLGDQSDPAALGTLLASKPGAAVAAPYAPSARAPLTTAAPAAADATAGASGRTAEASPSTAGCVAQAAAAAGDVMDAVYAAGLRWRGQDAEVIVFARRVPDSAGTREAVIMARPGCALLAVQRF